MTNPLVSVITPIYNCEKFVEISLNSLLNQTFKDFEVIVVNDGSSDKTSDIVETLTASHSGLFKYTRHMTNKGVSLRRVEAVRASVGKYIAIHDGDDVSLPDRLEKQVNFLENNPEVAFLGSHAYKIDEQNNRLSAMIYAPLEHDGIVDMVVSGNRNPMIDPTMMFRRESFDTLGGYSLKKDRKLVPDFDLWLRAILLGFQLHNLQEKLIEYRVNSMGNTRRYQKEMIKQHIIVRKEFISKYQGKK